MNRDANGEYGMVRQLYAIPWRTLGRKAFAIAVISILILVAAQAIIPSACAEPQEKVLSLGAGEAISTGNPFAGIYDIEYVYYGLIWDSMMTVGDDLESIPNIAESWWYMDGNTAQSLGSDFSQLDHNQTPADWPLGSIWEYNISHGIFWNDGEPLTAADVKWSINLQIGENYAIFWAYQPYTRWIDYAEMIDDYKVRIYFSNFINEYPMPVAWGSSLFTPIMPKHAMEDMTGTEIGFNWDGIPAIGTGPFMGTDKLREELLAKEIVTLVRNPYYDFTEDGERKGLGGVYNRTIDIDKIRLKFFSEEASLSLAVRNGDVDAAKLQVITYLQWKEDSSTLPDTLNLVDILTSTGYSKQICFNDYAKAAGDLSPLRLDPAVQRAGAISFNKTFLIDTVYKGLGHFGIGLISPAWSDWWWDPPEDETSWFNVTNGAGGISFSYDKSMADVMEYDPVLANELLNATGYDQWSGGSFGNGHRIAGPQVGLRMQELFGFTPSAIEGLPLAFEMYIDNSVFDDKLIANIVIPQWGEIGIELDGKIVGAAAWVALIYDYKFNTMITYWSGDPDPNYISFPPTSYSLYGWNEFGTDEEEYNQLYLKQATTLNKTERKYWVDEVTKWQYLSGSIMTPIYPRICFAVNNMTWDNWGDWEALPGLAIDHFWGSNPLWQQITYVREDVVDDGYDITTLAIGIGVIAAIVAIVAVISIMRKKKIRKLEEEEE